MIINQVWKDELVALVNTKNTLSLKSTDVQFAITDRNAQSGAVVVTISPDAAGPYFGEQSLTYIPRDIAKNFIGIPLRFIVNNDTTVRAIITQLATRFGVSLDTAVDFVQADLDKTISFADTGVQSVEVDMGPDSFVWAGKLEFTVANDTLSLETIIQNADLAILPYLTTSQDRGSLAMATHADAVEFPEEVLSVTEAGVVTKAVFSTHLDTLVARQTLEAADATAILAAEPQATVAFTLQTTDDVTVMSTVNQYTTPKFEGKVITMGEVVRPPKVQSILEMKMGAGNASINLGRRTSQYTIDWGDGSPIYTKPSTTSTAATHTYDANGPYVCKVTPLDPADAGWRLITPEQQLISGTAPIEITKWVNYDTGPTQLGLRINCPKLVEVPNYWPGWAYVPNLFRGCELLEAKNIGGWDVSKVTNFMNAFMDCSKFNTDISGWNVSNVTTFEAMFTGCNKYNQPMNAWNVSKATTLASMFAGAVNFNQPINDWKLTNVIDIQSMFSSATSFNQDLDKWDTSKVTRVYNLFNGARVFNGKIGTWNTANFEGLNSMFASAMAFNQDISGWNISKATSLMNAFNWATMFNQDISGWDTSNVTDMNGAFQAAAEFNADLSGWNVAKVTTHTDFDTDAEAWETAKKPTFAA